MKRGFPTKNLLYLHKRQLALLHTVDQIWVTLLGKIIQRAGQGRMAQTSSSKRQAPITRPTRSWDTGRVGWVPSAPKNSAASSKQEHPPFTMQKGSGKSPDFLLPAPFHTWLQCYIKGNHGLCV